MRAQTSLEMIVILGVLLLVFGGLLVSSNVALSGASSTNQEAQVGYALDQVTQTAQEVRSQGTGAKKQVFVQLPQSMASSQVDNRTLSMDIYAQEGGTQTVYRVIDIQMNGTLPSTSGGHYITVENFDSYVNIST